MQYRFHVNVFVMPQGLFPGDEVELRGERAQRLCGGTQRPPTFDSYFAVTFEQALEALTALPRLDAEPDGYFLASGDADGRRWQVDGHLFDFGGRLHRVELSGACPPQAFDALLRCTGWPAAPLAFELVREGVALDEPAFRRWASAPSG
jgi:hypothetical protein